MTTQTKHAVGPIAVTHQSLTDQSWDLISESESGGRCVATCGCCASPDSLTAANARRLAHCWNCHGDLVEALETFIGIYPLASRMHPDVNMAIEKARAALAKARGEQS